jgi:hypothetical protein
MLLSHSVFSNLLGIICFHASVAFLSTIGVRFAGIQVLIWFTVALATMAFLSGGIIEWPRDVLVAFGLAVALIGWVVFRTAEG